MDITINQAANVTFMPLKKVFTHRHNCGELLAVLELIQTVLGFRIPTDTASTFNHHEAPNSTRLALGPRVGLFTPR
jgi:hypothetical protein